MYFEKQHLGSVGSCTEFILAILSKFLCSELNIRISFLAFGALVTE
jgi:hypothetical protein